MSPEVNTSDPYAAYGGHATDPYAAYGGSAETGGMSPPAAGIATTTPPSPPQGGLGGVIEPIFSNPTGPAADQPAWTMARQGIYEAGRGLGGMLDMIGKVRAPFDYKNQYQIQHPGATDDQIDKAYDQETQGMAANRISHHLQDAGNWLRTSPEATDVWGKIARVGEQVLETYGPTELFKLGRLGRLLKVGGEVQEVATAGSRAAQTVEDLKQAQDVHATLSKNKIIAGLVGIGLKGTQDAALMGGQTYLHTEDPEEAKKAALWGGVIGAGAATGVEGAKALSNIRTTEQAAQAARAAEAAAAAEEAKPTSINVGGVPVSVLKEQVTPEGGLTGVTATGQGRLDVADTQRQDLQNVLQNKAQIGLRGTLSQANLDRAPQFQRGPLPVNPQQFKVGEGPNASWAETQPPSPYFKVGAGPNPSWAEKLPAPITTKSPQEAESWLNQIESMQRDPLNTDKTRQQLDEMHQSLSDQLGIHRSSAQVEPIDVEGALLNTRTLGDAGAQAHGAARDIYQMMDTVSDGQFNKLRKAEKKALSVISDHTASAEAVESAQNDLEGIKGQIDGLFTAHGAQLNPGDATAARNLYRDGIVYNQLHALVERMANGITLGETASGLPRVVTGNTEAFENFLSKGNNRDRVAGLIGQQGITDLKTMFQLTRDASLARKASDVVENVTKDPQLQKTLTQRLLSVPWGRIAIMSHIGGNLAAGLTPLDYKTGAALTSAAMITPQVTRFLSRQVVEHAAANGRVIKMIDFAVRNNLDPRIYAPLIARTIASSMQNDQPQQGEQPQEEKPQQ